MALTNDIELNGVSYNVVPGSYKKGLRKRLAVSKPAARRIGTAEFGPFERGVLQASADDEDQGWSSLTVGPVFDGEGVEPFPNSTTHVDAMVELPSATNRAYGVIAGTKAYIGIGRRIYESVALTNGTWASLTVATDLGVGFVISGLAYFQDDLLIMLSSGQDIRKYNTASGAVTVWRTGEKAQKGAAYAGQFIYAPRAANNQEELRLSGTKWNGNAITHLRYLDAPIINIAHFNGQVVIATRKSLYFMAGQPYPGEADDAAITGDSSRAPEWRGDPDPVMSHGVFAEGDDFTFLESYRGRLYTWLGGRVAEFDDSTEEASWRRMGPEGANCYGACVAGDWLIVAIASRYGTYEAWGFNGEGWWLLFQRTAVPAVLWPCPLAGAGNRDALLFRDGGGSYDLLRLRWRSTTLHTYATAGAWTSSVIDGDDPTADKAWRRMGATFASPGDRGNTASVDSVTFPVEYSIDGGVTWVEAVNVAASSGATRVLTREIDFTETTPPESRFLQLRQRWSSVSDWAPVLTRLWVEYENAEEYALGALAQAEYEDALAAEGVLRRRWELTIDAGDRTVRRDSQLDAKTGRQAIGALWDAWELGTELDFKDIDHDTDLVTYLVSIAGIEEKAHKPSDAARWGESQVTLVLEEGEGLGASAGGVHVHSLPDLDDVALGALADGQVLSWDSTSGQWVNEAPVVGTHEHDASYQPLDADLTALAGLAGVHGDVIVRGAAGWERLGAGASGQLLQTLGAGATPAWVGAAGSPPGVVLIDEDSFSAAAVFSMDGCFTGDYENYTLILAVNAFGITTSVYHRMRLRIAGADVSLANYLWTMFYASSSAASMSVLLQTFDTDMHIGLTTVNQSDELLIIDLMRPQVADATLIRAKILSGGGGGHVLVGDTGAYYNASAQFDGFSLYPDSSTISGTARVYGWRDAP
jgi:hypothetical protein